MQSKRPTRPASLTSMIRLMMLTIETKASEANDAIKVVEAVETKASKTNDAIEVVKTVEADACCFNYGCSETFAKQPMSR